MVNLIKINCEASAFVKSGVYNLNALYANENNGIDVAAVYEGDIEWSVVGIDSGGSDIAVKDGTLITADGMLTVAADETAAELRITAKSTKFGKSGTLTLPVST